MQSSKSENDALSVFAVKMFPREGGGFVHEKLGKEAFLKMRQQKQCTLDPEAAKWYRGLVTDLRKPGSKQYSPLTLQL